ncbi:MAG: NAD(P)-dependent oxidoreductase [Actinomycetia bacterium]|nr:NAD(P)-dependent oxidoreductase [Actinomycetes bacterium]
MTDAPGARPVGFIGLGAMGGPMAANVLKRFPVIAYDVVPERLAAAVAAGAEAASGPGEVADRADRVITMLPGSPAVEAVYLGSDGLVAHARPGQIFIDMTTCHPATTRKVGAALAARGAELLDAPVARTREAARQGTLAIMVGGSEATLEACRDLLATMGTDIAHCGPLGTGEVVKLVNNLILFNTVACLAECLPLAQWHGVAPARLVEILSRGSAASFALANHVGQAVLAGDFAPGKFSVAYALKDADYALALAEEAGVPLYHGALTKARLQEAAARGLADHYYPVLFTLTESLLGVAFRRDAPGGPPPDPAAAHGGAGAIP